MGIALDAYPKLSDDLIKKIGYTASNYEFMYSKDGDLCQLSSVMAETSNSRSSIFQIEDSKCEWHPDKYGLFIKFKCKIAIPQFLFGENGIAASNNSKIGVAISWMAKDSSIRGVTEVGEISSDIDENCAIEGILRLPKGTLRGIIVVQVVLFLKQRGNPNCNEMYLARFEGTVFGILDEARIVIDGNGALFPIHSVFKEGEPLWWVCCNWEDPTKDSFNDDHFCVYLNSAHRDYASLGISNGIKNSPMLAEITCSALQILVERVSNDVTYYDDTFKSSNFEPNSISFVVNYFMRTFSWIYESDHPEKLAIAIRKEIMSKALN